MTPVKKENLKEKRTLGKHTEILFCELMQKHDCFTYRFQEGVKNKAAILERKDEHIILADIWVINEPNNSYLVEVKGKYPNKYDAYGLEQYRIKSLNKLSDLSRYEVIYAIYDTRDKEWYWNSLRNLLNKSYKTFFGDTYINGEVRKLPICYFQKVWFIKIEKNGKINFPSI